MKKLIYLIVTVSLVFSSCNELNPLEDIYAELDAAEGSEEEEGEIIEDLITLSEEDYETLGLEDAFFTDNESAIAQIPAFLSSVYNAEDFPLLGAGSIVNVVYELEKGTNLESVDNFTSAETYTLENADYPGASQNATAFFESEEPSDFIPTILSDNITEFEEGSKVLVRYNQYQGEVEVGVSDFFVADFQTEQSLLNFEAISVTGDEQEWFADDRFGAVISGFSSGSRFENDDWLVSNEINLSEFPDASFQINQVLNFGNYEDLSILITTDYQGDVETTSWDEINLQTVPEGDSWDPVLSEEYSLSDYNGETIRIAFRYTSTTETAGTWEIFQVYLRAIGVTGETELEELFYTYDGQNWDIDDSNVYYLSSEDYDLMGEEFGQPGRFDNFSSSVLPENYLPAFLNLTYPFAQEDDTLIVIFKFFNGSVVLRGNEYTFSEGVWMRDTTSLQFGYDGVSWLPDNTINYTFASSDYDIVANSTELAEDTTFDEALSNLQFFGNFNRTGGSTTWTDEMMIRAIGIVLDSIDTAAEEGQKYAVTVSIFDGSVGTETFNLIKENGVWVSND